MRADDESRGTAIAAGRHTGRQAWGAHRTAPHKPLYLLLCIASLQHGKPRLQRFEDVRSELAASLRLFGKQSGAAHPQYPFWRLQHDGLAEVCADGPLSIRKSSSDPNVSSLLMQNARGGLIEKYHNLLCSDAELQSAVIHRLLNAHFPPSIHEDIILFYRLDLKDRHAQDARSTVDFRDSVIRAYGERCAISGFSAIVDGRSFGVEAAHIFWLQSGGNDQVTNGVAMTTLHRKLYHLGFFCIDDKFRIVVSPQIKDCPESDFSLRRLHGNPIRLPVRLEHHPSLQALQWHKKWVFKN